MERLTFPKSRMEFKSSALYSVTCLPWNWPVPCYQVPSPFPQSWLFFYCLFIYTLERWCHLQIDLLTCKHLLSIDLLKCKHPREEKHTLWYELPLPCFAQLLAKHLWTWDKGGVVHVKGSEEAVFNLVHQRGGACSPTLWSLGKCRLQRRWPLKGWWGCEISSGQTFSLSFLFKFFIKERQKYMGESRPWLNSLEKVLLSAIGTYS